MAIDLSIDQRKKLRAAGLTPDEIKAYQLGNASTQLRIKATNAMKSGTPTTGFFVDPHGSGTPQRTPNPSNTGVANYPTNPNVPALGKPPTGYGGRGAVDPMPDQPGRTDLGKKPPTKTNGDVFVRNAQPAPTPFIYDSPSNPYNIPNAPGAPNFNVPVLEMRDFTEQAKKIAAEAFAPFLAAFDIARTNAQAQGKTSKEATAGLYENFTKDIAKAAADTAGRFDEVKAETAARGEAQQADIAESQGSANANMAEQLKAYGLDVSAPTMLQQGVEQQTSEQAEAGAATESQQQFLDTQKLAQGNYDTQYGSIMGHQGLVAQQDLDSQLMNTLAGIDVNKANASGQQATTSLELAQQLADRDFQMQGQNASLSMQGQQMDYAALQDLFNNQMSQYTTWESQDQQDYANAFDLWKTQQGFDIDWATLAGAGAAGGGAGEFDMGDYPGQTQTYGWLKHQLGDDEAATDKVYRAIDDMLASYTSDASQIEAKETVQVRAANFARLVRDQLAASTGIPTALAQAAAANYYQEKKA